MKVGIVVKNHPYSRNICCTRDCPDREVGCHSTCEKYQSWRDEYNKIEAGIRKQKDADRDITAGRGKNIAKAIRIKNTSKWGG